MTAYVSDRKYDRQGRPVETTVVVDLDTQAVLTLLWDEVQSVTDEPVRYVSITVKFDQKIVDGDVTYEPATARAYVTAGHPR